MRFFNFQMKLREKFIFFTALVLIFSFVVINIFWFFNARSALQTSTREYIELAVEQVSLQVDGFIDSKMLAFLSHSQGAALLSGDAALIQLDLQNLMAQDSDIVSLSFVDTNGKELIRTPKDGELRDLSQSDAFKVANFRFGQEYVGPVVLGKDNKPMITIAVPVESPKDLSSLSTLSSGSILQRDAEDFRAFLIGEVDMTRLFANVDSLRIGKTGYVYIVDRTGRVLSYPNRSNIGLQIPEESSTSASLAVRSNTSAPVAQTQWMENQKSIDNTLVNGAYHAIRRNSWLVIAEQPVEELSEEINTIQSYAAGLFIVPLVIALILSLYFAGKVTVPLQQLLEGITEISRGNFDREILLKTGDELETIADSYTQMAQTVKASQERLQIERDESESKKNALSTILASIANGVIALDSEHKVVIFNRAAETITGIRAADIQGDVLEKQVFLKNQGEIVAIDSIASDPHAEVEPTRCSIFTNAIDPKTVDLKVAYISLSASSTIRYLLTFEDVTKEQELENMKLDFVSMAAHELRTPLTSIKGYLSMLNETVGEKLNDEEKDFFTRVMLSSDQLSGHIENLLNVTKIERGVLQIEYSDVSLIDIVKQSVNNIQEVANQRQIKLSFLDPKEEYPRIRADAFKIGEVVTNLIANAINYNKPNGQVQVSLELGHSDVIVHVLDTGYGIPKAALGHLFTKFYRVGGPLVQGSRGTGLGLYICKSIIDRHNGQIWVESEEGKGSRFSFSLPMISR